MTIWIPCSGASFAMSALPAWSKPVLVERTPIFVAPIFFIWAKTRAMASLSFCAVLKTYFATGFTIASAAAQDSSGVLPASASPFTCIVSPLVAGPMMAKTCSSSMSCFAKETAFSGLPPVSLTMSWIGWPSTPPLALRASTSIGRVRASGAPRKAAGPVTARSAPTFSGSAAVAAEAAVRPRDAARSRSFFMSVLRCDAWASLPQEHELAVLHGDHLEGAHAEAVVVGGREVEDAGGAHPAGRGLDGVADLVAVHAAGLDPLHEQAERVVRVGAEGAGVLLVLRLVRLLVVDQDLLLRVLRGEGLGDDDRAGGEDDALGGRAGPLHVADVGEAVALEDRHLEPDLAGVLDDDRLGRLDRPVEEGLHVGGLQLGDLGRQGGRRRVVGLVDDDLDSVLRRELRDERLARLAEAGVGGEDADLRRTHLLHLGEDEGDGVAVLLRRLEDVLRDGVHDRLGRGAGQQRRPPRLGEPLHLHRLAARRGADDGEDLLLVDELLREGDRLLRAPAGVLDDELDLLPGDAPLRVELLGEHLERPRLGGAEEGGRTGDGEERADLDGVVGRAGRRRTEGHGEGGEGWEEGGGLHRATPRGVGALRCGTSGRSELLDVLGFEDARAGLPERLDGLLGVVEAEDDDRLLAALPDEGGHGLDGRAAARIEGPGEAARALGDLDRDHGRAPDREAGFLERRDRAVGVVDDQPQDAEVALVGEREGADVDGRSRQDVDDVRDAARLVLQEDRDLIDGHEPLRVRAGEHSRKEGAGSPAPTCPPGTSARGDCAGRQGRR